VNVIASIGASSTTTADVYRFFNTLIPLAHSLWPFLPLTCPALGDSTVRLSTSSSIFKVSFVAGYPES
jgi:hypothetical protein